MSETIQVIVRQIRWQEDGKDWKVIMTDKGAVKGAIPWSPREGERLKLFGTWERSKYNGAPEFNFKSAMTDIPTDSRALLSYAVELTPGLGDARAQQIWDTYGEDWKTADLEKIHGLQRSTRVAWQETMEKLKAEAEKASTIAYFLDKGLTINLAMKAWEIWKVSAIGVVQADPYCLTVLPGVGFKTVDNDIAPKFGIGKDDPRRHDAAGLFVVGEICDSGGHTIVQRADMETEFQRLIGFSVGGQANLGAVIDRLMAAENLVQVWPGFFALTRDFKHDTLIMEYLSNG